MKTTIQNEIPAQTEWFKSWFDSEHYHKLYAHRDDQEAAEFISRLMSWLQPPSGSSILDLGCGSGRHSRHLASMGFDVTGIYLSAESISLARQSKRSHLQYHQQDMRLPFGTGVFARVQPVHEFPIFRQSSRRSHVAIAKSAPGSFPMKLLQQHVDVVFA